MNRNKMQAYLEKCNVSDEFYLSFLQTVNTGELEFRLFQAKKEDYMVNCFFDDSEAPGKGLIVTNSILQTENTGLLAIGLVEGDDVICVEPSSGCIKLWRIQNGNGEIIPVADSFQEFLSVCIA